LNNPQIPPPINPSTKPPTPFRTPSPGPSQNSLAPAPLPLPNLSKLLTDLAKLYFNDDKKFGGGIYNILSSKLRIFYNLCKMVSIPSHHFQNAYCIMLKGRASLFYYNKLSHRNHTFNEMIYRTRIHFETEETKQQYLTEWKETLFSAIINANPGISQLDCLQKLFDKLQDI
jgi:hypothetical protein